MSDFEMQLSNFLYGLTDTVELLESPDPPKIQDVYKPNYSNHRHAELISLIGKRIEVK